MFAKYGMCFLARFSCSGCRKRVERYYCAN
jgi:hypothetical protein